MFTENQVRQFYVASSTVAPKTDQAATVVATDNPGKTELVIKGDEAYFMYSGAIVGDLQRSDLMKKCNIMDVRLSDAADLKHKNKKAVLTLDTSLVSSSNLTTTEDYVLNVIIRNYVANGYDSTRIKFAAVRGVQGMSASDFYKKMAYSFAKSMKKEGAQLLKVSITKTNATGAAANNVEVTGNEANYSAISGTAVGIVLEEVEQPWRRGAAPVEYVDFEVQPSTVYANGADIIWGKVQFYGQAKYTDDTTSAVTIAAPGEQVNSKKVADMEWFFHKERGDKYGEIGWPNNIDTVYQVDPTNANGYSMVDIHYYYEGNSHNVGKSEKTITIVGTKANLKTLIGSPATTGQSATAATGLYAFLEGTGVNIKASASW